MLPVAATSSVTSPAVASLVRYRVARRRVGGDGRRAYECQRRRRRRASTSTARSFDLHRRPPSDSLAATVAGPGERVIRFQRPTSEMPLRFGGACAGRVPRRAYDRPVGPQDTVGAGRRRRCTPRGDHADHARCAGAPDGPRRRPRRARPGSRSSRGAASSTRSGRSRSSAPTRSRPSTAPRSGSCPRSASRSSATGPSSLRAAPARRSIEATLGPPRPCAGRGARRHAPRRVHASCPQPGTGRRLRGANLVFSSVGGPAFVTDLDRGRRAGNFADFVDYVRVIGALDIVHQEGGGPLEPNDLPVATRHLDMYRTFAASSTRPGSASGFGRRRRRCAGGPLRWSAASTATSSSASQR